MGSALQLNFGCDVATVGIGLCECDPFNPETRVLVSVVPSRLQSSCNEVVDCTSAVPVVADELCAEVVLENDIEGSSPSPCRS